MAKKRSKNEVIRGIQATLEGYRRFDFRYIPLLGTWKDPDEKYPYRQRGLSLFATYFWRTVLFLFTPLLLLTAYGGYRVYGKENLRALKGKGAVSVCNHINYIDTLFVRQAVGHFRSYHTMGPWNNKRGFGGHIIRHGGLWPFSGNLGAMRNLGKEMERCLSKGKIVNFYAEQVMWTNYQKPRPMKEGAFHYAYKFDVPVLPIFCTFRRSKRGHLKRVRIHILPAVYADKSLPRGECLRDMRERAQSEWKACYESVYGPLEWLPDRRHRQTEQQ